MITISMINPQTVGNHHSVVTLSEGFRDVLMLTFKQTSP